MSLQNVYDLDGIKSVHSRSVGFDMSAMHIHLAYEVYMVLSDGVKFFVNDRVYSLQRGDVMLFTNTDLHKVSVTPDEMYERYVITFPPAAVQAMPGEAARLLECFGSEQMERSHRLMLSEAEQREFIAIAEAINAEGERAELGRVGQLLELCRLLLLLSRVSLRAPGELRSGEHSLHPQIRAVLDHIDRNFTNQISLDELSALCYLNKHYLCRLFRQDTGFCIHDYISYRRLSHAMELLRRGESVSGAARLSGFGSDTFFITTFRKNIGMTPYRYARSQRGVEG